MLSDPIADLAGLVSECGDRQEYEAARLAWLEQAVGFDASYFGAAAPEQKVAAVHSGVDRQVVDQCEAHADRYWRDRLTLQQLAQARGGVMADHEALSDRARDNMPFYREVVAAHGIRATTVALLRVRGRISGSVFLGRTARGARFGSELLLLLGRALPVLALGDAAHAALASAKPAPELQDLPGLTPREQIVLRLLCRGWTNPQIAAQLGSSPRTVKNQVSAILSKTRAANRTQLTARLARGQEQ